VSCILVTYVASINQYFSIYKKTYYTAKIAAAMNMTRTQTIAGGAVFGAVSIAISLLHLGVPFLPVPYLVFEFAEIPVIISGMLFGPVGALISAAEYWGMLQLIGQFAPIGPAAAFLGVGSTAVGVIFAAKVLHRLNIRPGIWGFSALAIVIGALIRAPVETLVNFGILVYVAPGFAPFAAHSLGNFLGYQLSPGTGLELVLVFTATFNIIQTIVSVLPSAAVSELAILRLSGRRGQEYWLSRFTRVGSKKADRSIEVTGSA